MFQKINGSDHLIFHKKTGIDRAIFQQKK